MNHPTYKYDPLIAVDAQLRVMWVSAVGALPKDGLIAREWDSLIRGPLAEILYQALTGHAMMQDPAQATVLLANSARALIASRRRQPAGRYLLGAGRREAGRFFPALHA